MRKKIVAGNWKMNTTPQEGVILVSKIMELLSTKKSDSVEKIIAPPFTHLSLLNDKLKGSEIQLSAQNCHYENSGAYTGEVSPTILKSIGVEYVILGHSERRNYFNETNALLKNKVDKAIENELQIIFCVGEILNERNNNSHFEVVEKQMKESLFHLSSSQIKNIVIAYEPVWAIGTGVTATSAQAQEMHSFIRKTIAKKYGNTSAEEISILYGGSCNPKNAKELFACPDVDGGLIGGASLNADDFVQIINSF